MKRVFTVSLILLLLGALPGYAQQTIDRVLNDGKVRFQVSSQWAAIMEKTDGSPQAIVFQVPDNAAQGTQDTASVTVKTRELKDPTEFTATVEEEFGRSKAQAGYSKDETNADSAVHQYFIQRAKTRYLVRDSFMLMGTIAVQVRCQRPLLENTAPSWVEQFDTGCNLVVASLKSY